MPTLSNLAALLFSFTLAVDAAAGAQSKPDSGAVFAVYPGWDMDNGGNLMSNITEAECLKACSTSPSCLGCTYVPYGGPGIPPSACYLKDGVDTTTFKQQNYDCSAATFGPCGTFMPPGPTQCYTVTA
ncbi:hypothetical protein K438DRAFT_1972456 [Mycena galopus ATCC 62051]|nr:hypothetical protein K438DRAFT_1972456 [Mycena galopus ATCC 62051]